MVKDFFDLTLCLLVGSSEDASVSSPFWYSSH